MTASADSPSGTPSTLTSEVIASRVRSSFRGTVILNDTDVSALGFRMAFRDSGCDCHPCGNTGATFAAVGVLRKFRMWTSTDNPLPSFPVD